MLLQSHLTEMRGKDEVHILDLLPALPKAWSDGVSKDCALAADLKWTLFGRMENLRAQPFIAATARRALCIMETRLPTLN
jgi:hypothetical protein